MTNNFEIRFPEMCAEYAAVENSIELSKLTKKWNKLADADTSIAFGAIKYFKDLASKRIKASNHQSNSANARVDRILRTRDSSGKATARK